tara:strand:- start:3897 stop:4457 length:561 start_codon:yes stop_codon:yes gene_type:complete
MKREDIITLISQRKDMNRQDVSNMISIIKVDIEKGFYEAAIKKVGESIKNLEHDFTAVACCAIIEHEIKKLREGVQNIDKLFELLDQMKMAIHADRVTQEQKNTGLQQDIYIDMNGSKELDLPYFNDEEENVHIRNANSIWQTRVKPWGGHAWDEHHINLLKPYAEENKTIKLISTKAPGWWRIIQ